MSQREFQSLLGRMVVDSGFRARVREHGLSTLDADLTPLEQQRLLSAASDRGMDATYLVHKDFRLSKLYLMLPLTRLLLGRQRFLEEVAAFWSQNLPVSHYFIPESIDFCDHLQKRLRRGHLRLKYLHEILAYERAELELKRPRPDATTPPPTQTVKFRYDPLALFTSLSDERRPRAIPLFECTLTGSLDHEGQIQWRIRQASTGDPRPRGKKKLPAHIKTGESIRSLPPDDGRRARR